MRQFQEGDSSTRCLMNKIYEVKINKKTCGICLKCNQNY